MKTPLSLLPATFLVAAEGAYYLKDDVRGSSFFNYFNFYTGNDPTHGTVNFVSSNTANSNNYTKINSDNSIYIGVDYKNIVSKGSRGRDAVRLESKTNVTTGLFILDLNHMPTGCGTWPAWWTFGPNWPNSGEIDIIEGVNAYTSNLQTLHTNEGCSMASEDPNLFTGTWENTNCDVYATSNAGCGIKGAESSYGAPFNANKGGVYAMEWTNTHIQVWYFNRNNIPSDLKANTPNPSTWSKPVGYWTLGSNCPSSHFSQHSVIFDTTFCGDWAGNTWYTDCPNYSWESCDTYVRNTPSAFTEAYWSINYMQIYQNNNIETCTAENQDPYSTGTNIPCCNGLTACLKDWNNNNNYYYICKKTC
jgi:hypothetical protein